MSGASSPNYPHHTHQVTLNLFLIWMISYLEVLLLLFCSDTNCDGPRIRVAQRARIGRSADWGTQRTRWQGTEQSTSIQYPTEKLTPIALFNNTKSSSRYNPPK